MLNRYTQRKRLEKMRASQRRKREAMEVFPVNHCTKDFIKKVQDIWETIEQRKREKKKRMD